MLDRNFFESILPGYFDTIGIKKTENDICWQKFNTPTEVIQNMIKQYEFKISDKILILFNREFIPEILKVNNILERNIYFIADRDSDAKFISKYNKNVNVIYLEDQNKIYDIKYLKSKIEELNVKKFDIVFSNPPYGDSQGDKNLDLKIVEAILPYTEDAVIVQPGGWIDADSSTGKAKTWGNKFGEYIKSVIFFDANEVMGIKLKTHGAIVHYTKENHDGISINDLIDNEKYFAKNIADVTKYGAMWNKKVKAFKEYIESHYNDFMPAHAATSATSDFSIRFSRWCGNVGKSDFYSPINITGVEKQFVKKSYVAEISKDGNLQYMVISLNSDIERWNFVNYWKSKIVRFILSFYKHNIHFWDSNFWRAVPWMDFSQEWNDKKLCEYFNIDEELWNYIDNFIPNYYKDYDSGF